MTDVSQQDRIIVLIPAYQPGQALVATTRRLLAAGRTVVVVNDGSGPEYQPIFRQLDTRIHLIIHGSNKGKGAALKTGYRYIKDNFSDYVIATADADGQHDIGDVQKVALDYGHHPGMLLLGSRTFEGGHVPLRSKFGNVLTRKVFSLLTKQKLNDTQTGLRAFGENLVDFMLEVPGDRFEYEMNVLLACSRQGIEIIEVPITTIYENGNESSHFDPIKDSLAIYGQILKFASSSLLAFGLDYLLFLFFLSLTGSWGVTASVTMANIGARIISASGNFVVNRQLVFRHKGGLAKSAVSYVLLAGGILIANTILLAFLTTVIGIVPYLAKIIVEIALFCVSYIMQRNFIFAVRHRNLPR